MTKQIVSKNTENSNELYTVLPVFKKGIADVGSKIYRNINIDNLPNEKWVDAYGFDGIYEVSNLGRVKSLGRWVSNGKSERWVKEKILKQGKQKRDNRLSVMLSVNNISKSHSLNTLVYYSFYPEKINDNLRDEVYHKNKIQDDNRLVNLDYNKIQGKSYKISIDLGNVKHLKEARKKHHNYTKENSVFENNVTISRKCKVCKVMKPQNKYSIYGINTCNSCRYDIRLKSKGKKRKIKKDVLITDTVTKEVFKYVNKQKCIISAKLINRYANTGKLVYPYLNSKHKNPLLVELIERNQPTE